MSKFQDIFTFISKSDRFLSQLQVEFCSQCPKISELFLVILTVLAKLFRLFIKYYKLMTEKIIYLPIKLITKLLHAIKYLTIQKLFFLP